MFQIIRYFQTSSKRTRVEQVAWIRVGRLGRKKKSLAYFSLCLYLYCVWRSIYQEDRVGITLAGSTPLISVHISNQDLNFHRQMSWYLSCSMICSFSFGHCIVCPCSMASDYPFGIFNHFYRCNKKLK